MRPLVLFLALSACDADREATMVSEPTPAAPETVAETSAVPRMDFNRIAYELAQPLFWVVDDDSDDTLDPEELAVPLGPWEATEEQYVKDGAFTEVFDKAYAAIAAVYREGFPTEGLAPEEAKRREKVREELDFGRPTLVLTDLGDASDEDRAVLKHLLDAGKRIDVLYARQTGAAGMMERIPENDPASRMLLYRNHGPWCDTAALNEDPDCSALPERPPLISGLYPADLQSDPGFCGKLEADQPDLMDPFTVVRRGGDGALKAVPYSEAYADDMKAISDDLHAAAEAIESEEEQGFRTYLLAAAQAFLDNDWFAADEAWLAMGSTPTKWYLRVGPDEVYFEPCNRKAAFHMSLARIDPSSLEWRKRLEPVKTDMEKALADLAGPPYVARDVAFHMPDFIQIVLNAGDSRDNLGAVIGQSLPNWGPVAEKGGRTVVMTNLYTDPDSVAAHHVRLDATFCPETIGQFGEGGYMYVMTTVLHEAAHNLGPDHTYLVDGKADDELFGGGLSSVMEELKAQTAAMYYTDWLAERGLIDEDEAPRAHAADTAWGLQKFTEGFVTPSGSPRAYSQLAAIQIGSFMDAGAITWHPEAMAANGEDQGCFQVHSDIMPGAVHDLMAEVASIKARGDREAAEALRQKYVFSEEGDFARLRDKVVPPRWKRGGKESFIYAVRY